MVEVCLTSNGYMYYVYINQHKIIQKLEVQGNGWEPQMLPFSVASFRKARHGQTVGLGRKDSAMQRDMLLVDDS